MIVDEPKLVAAPAPREEPAPAPAKPRAVRAPDADDHLAAYFRQLAEHELLTPEDERELSQGIEDTEILTWERVLARPETVAHVLSLVEPNLEQPVKFPNLDKACEAMLVSRKTRKDGKLAKKLVVAAKEAASQLRALDLDRVHIDAVVRELYRARQAALAGEITWWDDAGTKDAGGYVDEVRQAHRDAANLRDEFVRANLRLVVTMARRYDRGGMPLADLIQEGNLGLMHAVSRFDYRRGLRFSTYACWWIRHAIGRALADKARAVRIPVHMLEAQQQLEKVRQALVGELGRPPTPQELAKAARVPLAKLNQMHRYIMGQPMSLDRPVHDDDDRSFGDTMADPDSEEHSPADDLTTQTLTSQVKRLLHFLSPIEADVLTKRFGLGDDEERTFREIGDQYHLSRERIRQIQNSALDKLKRALEREHRGHVEM
ncbi:MAG: sigma-70 family RNA polymerase sigma factor [Deltaproteobacteria bacterium]|nr:sigma-70 family RNA polymerase sigma factor [Deltaproteobacteria bacterium]MCW5807602.1 sigma-70 family RNA polymerase sigma factor [Deltaproteobacteria bacterium]